MSSNDAHHDLMKMEFDVINTKLNQVQEKLDTLLQQTADPDKDSVIKDLQRQVSVLESKLRGAKVSEERRIKAVREARLLDLMKPLMQMAWRLDVRHEYALPKCPLCDEGRKRHFMSPSGRQMVEDCSCSRMRPIYFVKEVEGVALDVRLDGGYDYFFIPKTWRNSKEEERLAAVRRQNVYNGESFRYIFDRTMQFSVVFLDKGTAEKFVEWMNNEEELKEPSNG